MDQEKSRHMVRCFDYLLIAIFLTAIFVPAAVQLVGMEPDLSNDEKRELAQMPNTPASFDEVLGFPESFTSYVNDRFGLRKLYLRLGSKLRWMLDLKVTPKVLFGKDRWLYLAAHDNIIDQFRGIDLFTRDELISWVQTMVQRRDWLLERGIPFILVVAPNKHTIYPEYLPNSVGKVLGETPLDQLTEYISANTDLDFVDLRGPVMAAKKEHRVFYKTDSHWNEMGGFAGYRALMERVKKYFPHVEVLKLGQFSVGERVMLTGDLAGMMNLQGEVVETVKFLIPEFSSHILKNKATGQKGIPERIDVETNLYNMPNIWIYSDSFIWGLVNYLCETFHRVVIVSHNGLSFDPALIEEEKPDMVIYEVVERAIRKKIYADREFLKKIEPAILNNLLTSPGIQLKKIRFGDRFSLLGLKIIDAKKGQTVQLIWKSLKKQSLSYINAIHLVDKEGKILSGFDYRQNKGEAVVSSGDTWFDEVSIPRMKGASAIAIGIYTKKEGLLPIDRGPRDWDGKRLVIPLP